MPNLTVKKSANGRPATWVMKPTSLVGRTLSVESFRVTVREKIGEGGYATVYRCDDSQGRSFALKFVNCLTQIRFSQFSNEATILRSLGTSNPHIVKLFAVVLNPTAFQIVFLFEFCPASAIGLISRRPLTREEVLVFFHGLCNAVAFLHSQSPPIIHRDLKVENLLVGADGLPRLCDFGSATRDITMLRTPDDIVRAGEDIDLNTTMNYRAPEMLDLYRRIPIGPPADVWALGCTLFKLLCRDELFKPEERLAILQAKLRLPQGLDPQFVAMMQSCIQMDPAARSTAADLARRTLQLRGPRTQVFEPQERSVAAPPKDKGRVAVSGGMQSWVAKATAASGDPPKQKHVRRIVAATVKQPSIAGGVLAGLFDRPWQADPRVAAKVLYVVLLIFQFSANVSADAGGPVMEIGRANQRPKKKTNWTVTAVSLASVISSKLKFHGVCGGLEGNFASPEQARPRNTTDYLAAIASLADFIIKLAAGAGDFAINVLACPIVEELSNAYVLARWSEETQGPELKNAGTVLSRARQLPYLDTAVEYPDPARRAPVQRFPQSEQ